MITLTLKVLSIAKKTTDIIDNIELYILINQPKQ